MTVFNWIGAGFRWTILAGLGSAPFALAAYSFAGWNAAMSTAIWVVAIGAWFSALSEWGISRALRATPSPSLSSFSSVRVLVWSDPRPLCFVARSAMFSKGAIYISQGLTSTLHESEWLALIQSARLELGDPALSLRTSCAWLAYFAEHFSPRPIPRRVRDAFMISLVAAATVVLRGISGVRALPVPFKQSQEWNNAMRKVSRDVHLSGLASYREDRALRSIALPLSVISI